MRKRCGFCNEEVKYISSNRGSWYVHLNNGQFMAGTGDNRHDCNTYIKTEDLTITPECDKIRPC